MTVTAGWWEAYSMFLEGEATMALSYTTSPAYHAIAEGDATLQGNCLGVVRIDFKYFF